MMNSKLENIGNSEGLSRIPIEIIAKTIQI